MRVGGGNRTVLRCEWVGNLDVGKYESSWRAGGWTWHGEEEGRVWQ